MEAVLTRKIQLPSPEPEEIDYRSLPQTTVRKVIKQCLENGTFDTTPLIDSRPLIEYVPGGHQAAQACIEERAADGEILPGIEAE